MYTVGYFQDKLIAVVAPYDDVAEDEKKPTRPAPPVPNNKVLSILFVANNE